MAIGKTNAVALLTNQAQPVPESPTTHKVIFIDPFGIVNEQWVENGSNAVVPIPIVYENLTFDEWNQNTENVTENRVIGATYKTTDSKTYAFVTFTPTTGKNIILYFWKNDSSVLTVDWGDNTTSTFSNIGNFNTGTHVYPANGDYIIKIWISTGLGIYGFGQGTSATVFVGGSTALMRRVLTKLYIGSNVTSINSNSFYYCHSLSNIVIPKNVLNILDSSFFHCYALISIVTPINLIILGSNAFSYCYSLYCVSVSSSITNINGSCFFYCFALKYITLSNSITSIITNSFYLCYSLSNIALSRNLITITNGLFYQCFSLQNIRVFDLVSTIESYAFGDCRSLKKIIFHRTTPPSLQSTDAFAGIIPICKIYVPDASLTAYKTATNWATYANYIYPLSDIGE